jgi:ubiquinone/menaquinone biosynthesis C-methylase UbiE
LARQPTTYDAVASRHETRWARYLHDTLKRALGAIDGPPQMRVMDLSCGTGLLLEHVVRRFPQAQLLGIDASSGMLRQAVAKPLAPNAQFIQALADTLPVRSGSFDRIVSTNAFHHFLQPTRVIEECRRALTPSGQLLILDWCREAWRCRLIDWWLRLVDRAHVRMYTRRELSALLSQAGFIPQRAERFRVSWVFGLKLWDILLIVATPQPIAVSP